MCRTNSLNLARVANAASVLVLQEVVVVFAEGVQDECVCVLRVYKLLSLQTCGRRSFNAKWDRTSGWTSAPRNLVSYFGTVTSQFSGEVADVAIIWAVPRR